jgi:putative transposase
MPVREKKHRLQPHCYQGRICISFTVCINDRNPFFIEPAIVNIFKDLLNDSANKFSCILPAYCFMPDHVHIVVEGTQDEVSLLKFINYYKQKTGFWMSKNRPGRSWQKNFFDHIIRKDEGLLTVIRYILDNPVRKGLVSDWRDYPFKGAIGCGLDEVLDGLV